ncbi:MAG: hypothetical protein ACPW61_07565 [Methyloligella sp. ZOD6]
MGQKITAQRRGQDGTRLAGELPAGEIADLVQALRDLQTIKATAADSAGLILTACERLLETLENGDEDKCRQAAEDAAIEIMTACGFEDLVGQRATHASRLIEALMAKRLQDLPCVSSDDEDSSETLSQARVDALLAEEK